jgi:hypothetical protein
MTTFDMTIGHLAQGLESARCRPARPQSSRVPQCLLRQFAKLISSSITVNTIKAT